MRKPSARPPPRDHQKVYINLGGLEVRGRGVPKVKEASAANLATFKGNNKRRIEIFTAPSTPDHQLLEDDYHQFCTLPSLPPNKTKAEAVKLNVTTYANRDVTNLQLKKIRETFEAADFERLLSGLRNDRDARHRRMSRSDGIPRVLQKYTGIYQEFFGRHYDYLKKFNAINARQ